MDQNKFINTYIEIVINSLQEHIKANLQLQTQVKVNEFIVAEKDQIISSLTQQINDNKITENWKVKYEEENKNHLAILGKLKHMDTLLSQVNDMKKLVVSKDAQIEILNKELENLKNNLATKAINTKVKKKAEEPVKEKLEKTLDDF